jgi:glutaminase
MDRHRRQRRGRRHRQAPDEPVDLQAKDLAIAMEFDTSERDTGHRSRAISQLLRNVAVIEEHVEPGLDLDVRQCSIRLSGRELGVMAIPLACQGGDPLTGHRHSASAGPLGRTGQASRPHQ